LKFVDADLRDSTDELGAVPDDPSAQNWFKIDKHASLQSSHPDARGEKFCFCLTNNEARQVRGRLPNQCLLDRRWFDRSQPEGF
jgi:hypothetical protein